MEQKCSIGTIPNFNCNIRENRKNCKIDVEELSLLGYELLKITKIKNFNALKNMCKYHKPQFVTEFSNYYRRADPLRSHKNVVKTSLHEITLEEFRLYCIPQEILGQKLCFRCKNKVFVEKKENENVDTEHENENEVMEADKTLHETANDIANQFLEILSIKSIMIRQNIINW